MHLCVCYDVDCTVFDVVCKQEAQSYADENGLLFMETSAKTAMNVNEIFMSIGTETSTLLIIYRNY